MTTPSTPRKAGPLLGTGAQTSWPFTFKVFAASDIAVTIANNLGVETALVLNADYSVTLNSNQDTSPGGTVTYPISGSALPSGSKLTIFGNLPYDQPLDLPSGGNFSPLALENQLDRLTMQIQQLREQVGRAVQVSVTTSANVGLPPPAASNIIGWSENGDNLENYPLSELATSLAFATYRYDTFTGDGSTTQFTLSADPVTLGNLDVAISGVTQVPGTDYLLVDGVLQFTSAPANGTVILARYGEGIASGPSMDSYDVRFRQAGTGAVDRTAEAKMREFVSVKDFGAVGDGVTDDTAAFVAAMDYIQAQGAFNELASPNNWPSTKRFVLTGPPGTYCFSGQIITPENARPDYVNFDISFPGAVFKALPGYNHANSLIHMKAAFDYKIEGIGFVGFKTSYVIFNDSSLTQNYGGKTVYRDLRFAECDYGIRHELESVVAVIDQCMTDSSMIQFLFVWRCDQMVIRDSFFNWSQTDRVTGEGYIEFGADQYTPTGEAAFPGGGTYNVGRLLMENCMCIPVDTPVVEARTAWVKMISGSLVIRSCHFGPEASNSRPFTVWSRIQGARYTGITDLVDAGITIEDSSCVNSWGMIYCDEYYPNYIRVRNIRFNVLDYSPNGTQRFLLAGDPGVLNPKSTNGYYTAAMNKYFMFDFGESVPQDNAIIPFNPNLLFPKFVSVYPEIALQDSYDTLNTSNQYAFFDLFDRDTLKPNFYEGAALYEFTLTGKMVNSVGPVEYNVSYKGLVEISTAGNTMYIDYGSLYATPRSTPAPVVIEAFLYDIPGAASYASRLIATVIAGNYCIRVRAYTADVNTTWQGTHAKIRRIT